MLVVVMYVGMLEKAFKIRACVRATSCGERGQVEE